MNEILIPTGLADLVDQIIIVQGKAHAATDPAIRSILAQRLNLMQRVAARVMSPEPPFDDLRQAVVSARHDLMQLEADLRACEARSEFDVAFVALTRAYLQARDDLEACKLTLDGHAHDVLMSQDAGDIPASG